MNLPAAWVIINEARNAVKAKTVSTELATAFRAVHSFLTRETAIKNPSPAAELAALDKAFYDLLPKINALISGEKANV
jgi:hypothetical protein